jgi:hypothetical protein
MMQQLVRANSNIVNQAAENSFLYQKNIFYNFKQTKTLMENF